MFTAPSDLAGSILVKILHCGEGGDVEQVTRISKQISCVCDCLSLSLSLVFNILLVHIVLTYICLILLVPH